MSIWGKILGGAAGFALGGPLGALFGALAGHVYDAGRGAVSGLDTRDPSRQIAFTIAVIALGAKLAKADGVVTREEVHAFKRAFQVAAEEESAVARFFDQARRLSGGFEPYAHQIAGLFRDDPAVLEQLLGCLFTIARADGKVTPEEIAYLREVARIFGFSAADFSRISSAMATVAEGDPYQSLGMSPDASDANIKAAWRNLVREHHPDRVIAKGLPPEFIAVATEKLAAINAAYDHIRKERGIP
ncbi:MAG: molecular chaperone DjiA [Alphaproteobacteria bacterium]|nr:molecular chaperone DjiA [Alphaproteobacteria bacterium]